MSQDDQRKAFEAWISGAYPDEFAAALRQLVKK